MRTPTNEAELVVYFAQTIKKYPQWELTKVQARFPDAVLLNKTDGESYLVEFEFESRSFKEHGHNIRGCDLVVCWKHTWPDCPIHIWELSKPGWKPSNPDGEPVRSHRANNAAIARRANSAYHETRREQDRARLQELVELADERAADMSVRQFARLLGKAPSYTHKLMRELGLIGEREPKPQPLLDFADEILETVPEGDAWG